MNGYLVTLLGVIVLGVLIDVILPSGSISKYISGIFAIFVLFVIISPIITFIKNDYKITDYFTNVDIELNEKLLYNMNETKLNALETSIQEELNADGYCNVIIDIQFELVEENVKITQVLVDLTNLVINNLNANINKYVYIRQVVQANVNVAKEVIVFCE